MKSTINYLRYILPSKMATLGIVSFIIFGLVSSIIIDSSMQNNNQNLQAIENTQPTPAQQAKPLEKVATQEAKTVQPIPAILTNSSQLTAKTYSSPTVMEASKVESCRIG